MDALKDFYLDSYRKWNAYKFFLASVSAWIIASEMMLNFGKNWTDHEIEMSFHVNPQANKNIVRSSFRL